MKSWQKSGLLLLGMIISGSTVEAQTTLRFQFKEGDKFGYALEQKMKMSTAIGGKDIENQMDMNMNMSWQVLKANEDGSSQIKMAFTGVKMIADGPLGKVEVDSKNLKEQTDLIGKTLVPVVKALAGMEVTFTMDPTGDMKDIKIPEKVINDLKNMPGSESMGDMFSPESLKKMAHGGLILPKEAITKGKTWSQKTDMKMPMGQMKGDIQFTYEGPVEKDGKKLEKITLKPTITLEAAPKAGFKMDFKSQEGKGTVYFDNAAGRIQEIDSQMNMEMTMEVNNMNILQKMAQNSTMKLAK